MSTIWALVILAELLGLGLLLGYLLLKYLYVSDALKRANWSSSGDVKKILKKPKQ